MEHISNKFLQGLLEKLAIYINKLYKEFGLDDKIEDKSHAEFCKYFNYRIYSEKGIIRRILDKTGTLHHYWYDKSHNKYNPTDSITQLFRHIVIDWKDNIRIISLGITKSVSLSENIATYPDSSLKDYIIQEFPAGTQIVNNISLSLDERLKEETEEETEEETDTKPTSLENSTRKLVGANGSFNKGPSFNHYWISNNNNANFYPSKMPQELTKDKAYVYSCSNKGEHITEKSYNILVMAYKFKSFEECSYSWQKFTTSDNNLELLKAHFSNMVIALDLKQEQTLFAENGCGIIQIPKRYNFDTYKELQTFIESKPHTYQGVNIWCDNGVRCKYKNPKYEFVRNLAGNECILPSKNNERHLFNLYWRLYKEKQLDEFFKYYDDDKKTYYNIFKHYKTKVYNFTSSLFNEYQDTHVLRKKDRDDTPFYLKDLCKKLHFLYKNSKTIITPTVVRGIVNDMDNRIYGRIFTPMLEAPKSDEDVGATTTENVDATTTEIVREVQSVMVESA
jgi:hypothetical protein